MGDSFCLCNKDKNINGNMVVIKGDVSLVDNQQGNNNNNISKNQEQNNAFKKKSRK